MLYTCLLNQSTSVRCEYQVINFYQLQAVIKIHVKRKFETSTKIYGYNL